MCRLQIEYKGSSHLTVELFICFSLFNQLVRSFLKSECRVFFFFWFEQKQLSRVVIKTGRDIEQLGFSDAITLFVSWLKQVYYKEVTNLWNRCYSYLAFSSWNLTCPIHIPRMHGSRDMNVTKSTIGNDQECDGIFGNMRFQCLIYS